VATQLSDLFGLESYRAKLTVSTTSADSIVVDFNVFEYSRSHFLSRLKSLTMDDLDLHRVERLMSNDDYPISTFSLNSNARFQENRDRRLANSGNNLPLVSQNIES
jgi:hypothetical protein